RNVVSSVPKTTEAPPVGPAMSDPRTQLLDAIANGDADRVRALVAADPELASARDDQGVSALLLARYRSDEAVIGALRDADRPLDAFEAAAFAETQVLAAHLAT